MMAKRRSRNELLGQNRYYTSWPTVAEEELGADLESFQQRVRAIKMYCDGCQLKDIQEITGLTSSSIRLFALRCISPADDGDIWGFRALIPRVRVKEYRRVAKLAPKPLQNRGGHSGALMVTLERFSKIEETLLRDIRKEAKLKKIPEFRLRPVTPHKIFLDFLKKQGVGRDEWPFNTSYLGRRSIEKYMRKVLEHNFDHTVINRESKTAIAHLAVGRGESLIHFEEPYDAVEIDAYRIDAILTVAFDTPEKVFTDVLLERLWLLVLLERLSTAVLDYRVVYRSEVSAEDVVSLLRRAVDHTWQPHKLSVSGLTYPKGGGLPSGVFEELRGAVWGVLMLDGALANLADAVRERARKALGFAINWGPVGHFERRPNIERLFRSVSDEIFKRYPSTTGAHPHSGRAPDAETQALRYRLRASEAEELLDVYMVNHNVTPTEGLSWLTPLEFLEQKVNDPNRHFLVRHLPTSPQPGVSSIPCVIQCTVRGGVKDGRRPHIQIDRVIYTSPVLAESPGLIGVRLTVHLDEEDMRQVQVFLPNGKSIGFLRARGRWGVTKHSRSTRKAINSLMAKRVLIVAEHDDPIRKYLEYKSAASNKEYKYSRKTARQNATEAARISHESDLPLEQKDGENILHKANENSLKPMGLMRTPMPNLKDIINRRR